MHDMSTLFIKETPYGHIRINDENRRNIKIASEEISKLIEEAYEEKELDIHSKIPCKRPRDISMCNVCKRNIKVNNATHIYVPNFDNVCTGFIFNKEVV